MTLRKLASLLALAWVGACSDNPPNGPDQSSGPDQSATIRIAALTSGTDMDADGYLVRLDADPPVPLATNEVLSLSGIAPGRHAVELGSIADNCALVGRNPDSVTATRGVIAEVSFVVGCRAVGRNGLVVSDAGTTPGGPPLGAVGAFVRAGALGRAHAGTDSVAYVSLAAGSVPDGRVATVRGVRAGLTLTTGVLDGGFDPVAVPAEPGDSLEVTVNDASGGTLLRRQLVVMATRRPVVVRTQPPPRKRDIALNTAVVVVFSEPVDPATVTGESVQLLRGTTSVAGAVRLLDGTGVAAVFEPADVLAPLTDYRLVVTNAIRDRQGDVLDAPVAVDFTTGDALAGPVASVRVSHSLIEGFFPVTTVIRAYVSDASGHDLTGKEVTWASSDSAVASLQSFGNEAWLTLRAGGVVTITAASDGRADTALVISRPLPPDIATGALRVIVLTTGDSIDGSVSVTVDGGPASWIASNDTITFSGLSVGTHTVALGGVAANCGIADPSGSEGRPRTVTVMGGDTTETTIAVACTARTGTLRVIVTTTGDSLDADGYVVTLVVVDHGQSQRMSVNDTVVFAGFPAGLGSIYLGDVAANCTVTYGLPPAISASAVNTYVFAVACVAVRAPGALDVTTATTGVDLPKHYAVSVDGWRYPVGLGPNDRAIISPFDSGTHSVLLDLVPSNCRVAGDNPRAVTVSAGDTTPVAFQVTCSTAERIAYDLMFCMPYPQCEPHPIIGAVFADGSNERIVTSYGREPAWSPAGDRIAFTSVDGDINVVTYDGSEGGTVTRLTTHSANDRSPAWSPDGSRIAFASDRDGQPELYLMNPDGSAVVRVTNGVGFVGQPAWSPDGARIAFDCEVQTGNRDICAVNVDGTAFVRLTNDPAADFDPAWSPGGGKIAFATERYGLLPEIAVMAVDGTGVTRVRAGTSGVEPSWAPDGARMAFTLSAGAQFLGVMNADGSGLVQLRYGAANPAWGPPPLPTAP